MTHFGSRVLGDHLYHLAQSLVPLPYISLIRLFPKLPSLPCYTRPQVLSKTQSVFLILSQFVFRSGLPVSHPSFHSHLCWSPPPGALAIAPCSMANVNFNSVLCRQSSFGKLAHGDAPSYAHVSTTNTSRFTHTILTVVPLALPVHA